MLGTVATHNPRISRWTLGATVSAGVTGGGAMMSVPELAHADAPVNPITTAAARNALLVTGKYIRALCAQDIIDRKDGDENVPHSGVGIAVTMMATLDVLMRAAANGDNLIMTHEPTFYGHKDGISVLEKENDPFRRLQ